MNGYSDTVYFDSDSFMCLLIIFALLFLYIYFSKSFYDNAWRFFFSPKLIFNKLPGFMILGRKVMFLKISAIFFIPYLLEFQVHHISIQSI